MTAHASGEPPAPIVMAVAPNGGRRTKQDHPALPLTAAELARAAAACGEAGAAMVHLHVRDAAGRHLLEAAAYQAALAAVRAAVGDRVFLQISSESLGAYRPAEQMAVVRAVRPEGVSLGLREYVGAPGDETAFADFLAWLKRERIAPQFILYAPEELDALRGLCRRGLVPWDDPAVLLVLGRYAVDHDSAPDDLLPFLAANRPSFGHWMLCAFGRHEAACMLAAALRGGHARVGFENNLHLPDGSRAPDNAALVAATAALLRRAGRRLATAADLRDAWSRN